MKEARAEILQRLIRNGHIDTDEYIILSTTPMNEPLDIFLDRNGYDGFDFWKSNIA